MKRFIFILITMVCVSIYAQKVSMEEADNIAQQYLLSKDQEIDNSVTQWDREKDIVQTTVSTLSLSNKAQMFVVQFRDGGWVLVSSNKSVEPILAAAEGGYFPEVEELPDGMKWLFSYYEGIIANADTLTADIHPHWVNPQKYKETRDLSFTKIDDFQDLRWGQYACNSVNLNNNTFVCTRKYNKYCPNHYYQPFCNHTVTGCAAVAIGQVMKYYGWPHSAIVPDSIITDIVNHTSYYPTPKTTHCSYYDWDVIPHALYEQSSTATENAIATLLKDCGYSMLTYYGENSSPTDVISLGTALVNTFGYSSSMQLMERANTDSTLFFTNIKNEIDKNHPVIYYGHDCDSLSAEHIFIIYGYNSNNKYFINWGWHGIGQDFNPVYSLDSLYMSQSANSFNCNQGAYINIYPDYCFPQQANSAEDLSDSNIQKVYIGNIEIGNHTINSNQQGYIYATNSIRLTSGFTISAGANIRLGIFGVPSCGFLNEIVASGYDSSDYLDGISDTSRRTIINNKKLQLSNSTVFATYPNPVEDILTIETSETLENISIYDLNGQCVFKTTQTQINVANFPQGMYLLRATTTDGTPLQAKFIKQ